MKGEESDLDNTIQKADGEDLNEASTVDSEYMYLHHSTFLIRDGDGRVGGSWLDGVEDWNL
uniref:Putative ovule protein n=1 Tax=Solanum chacoense TaxID=4108 RepID=A0A0V0GHW0_SOLCH